MSQTGPWGSQRPSFPVRPQAPVVYASGWQQARPGWQPVPPGPGAWYGQQHARPMQPYGQAPGPVPPQAPWAGQPGQRPVRTGQPLPPRARPRKTSWLPVVIPLVAVFVVVAPLVAAVLASANQPARPTAPGTARAADRSGPSSPPAGQPTYSPGPVDTHPDDPPVPTTYTQVHQTLESSPLYSQDLPPTDCSITSIDLATAPVSQIEDHLNTFVDCLVAAWSPPVTAAGFELPHPSVTVYTTQATSPCGDLPMENASYCSADQQIYYADDLVDAFPSDLSAKRFVAESILAHEFGHEVQYRTMILVSAAVLESGATTDDQMDLSRRTEMQADCFAGVFLRSVSRSAGLTAADQQNILSLFTDIGGATPYSDDHGTGTNRAAWAAQGLASTTPGACVTFTAPADAVG